MAKHPVARALFGGSMDEVIRANDGAVSEFDESGEVFLKMWCLVA